MHNAGIEPRSLRACENRRSSQLSHAGIYCHIIKGLMMTSDSPQAAARQIWLFVTDTSPAFFPPPPPIHH